MLKSTGFAAGDIEMFMQPIVDMVTGEPVIIEALARLRTPDGRIVDATTFIPPLSAAELEQLFIIGLDQSLKHLALWEACGMDVSLSVNLDPSTLMNPDCANWVRDALHRHGIAPGRLVLELLETRAVNRDEQRSTLAAIRDIGVRLAIDDLGSGYSTLERVAHHDFDVVKIAAGVLDGFAVDPIHTLSVMFTLTQLSVNLRRDAVVEGLETIDMVGVAVALGARLGQGYVYARPMPAADLPAWANASVPVLDSTRLATYPAALAYHWRYSRHATHPGRAEDCPIAGLLSQQGGSSPVAEWHKTQHGMPRHQTETDGTRLLAWLVDQVVRL